MSKDSFRYKIQFGLVEAPPHLFEVEKLARYCLFFSLLMLFIFTFDVIKVNKRWEYFSQNQDAHANRKLSRGQKPNNERRIHRENGKI